MEPLRNELRSDVRRSVRQFFLDADRQYEESEGMMSSDPPIDNVDPKEQADKCIKIALDEMARANAGHPPTLPHIRNVAGHAVERIRELEDEVACYEAMKAGVAARIAELESENNTLRQRAEAADTLIRDIYTASELGDLDGVGLDWSMRADKYFLAAEAAKEEP